MWRSSQVSAEPYRSCTMARMVGAGAAVRAVSGCLFGAMLVVVLMVVLS